MRRRVQVQPFWVQGAAQSRRSGRALSEESRQSTLAKRLSGSVLEIQTSAGTKFSEKALGFAESVYFYVNAADPAYGDSVVLFRPTKKSVGTYARVSPFDTGGVAQGHVAFVAPFSLDGLRHLVNGQSFELRDYVAFWAQWAIDAYRRLNMYVEGSRPRFHSVPEVDLNKCTSQGWLWEVRLMKARYTEYSVKPMKLFVAKGDRRRFSHWLKTQAVMGDDQLRKLQREYLKLAVESKNPARSAQRYIQGRGGA